MNVTPFKRVNQSVKKRREVENVLMDKMVSPENEWETTADAIP